MLLSSNEDETNVDGFHSSVYMTVRMRKIRQACVVIG